MPQNYIGGDGGGGGDVVMKETIVSDDLPGTGTNLLGDGEGRFWTHATSETTYLVTRRGTSYKLVELTE